MFMSEEEFACMKEIGRVIQGRIFGSRCAAVVP